MVDILVDGPYLRRRYRGADRVHVGSLPSYGTMLMGGLAFEHVRT